MVRYIKSGEIIVGAFERLQIVRSGEIESCQFVVEAEERRKTGKACHAVYGSERIVVATQIIETRLPRYV